MILAAKTAEAARFAGIEFMRGRVRKTYEALVFGRPPAGGGLVDLPLGRDLSSGFQTVRVVDRENGKPAATRYRTLWSDGRYSRLELEPLTGRTHQIRAHLAALGCPVVGDKIYLDLDLFRRYVMDGWSGALLERLKLRRLALHATQLVIRHPRGGDSAFESPAPDFLGSLAP